MNYHKKQEQTMDELRQELYMVKQQFDKSNGCPCVLVEPCSKMCTCASPVLSGGCRRCARYGSVAQRVGAAQQLVKQEKQLQAFKDQAWVENYKGTKSVN